MTRAKTQIKISNFRSSCHSAIGNGVDGMHGMDGSRPKEKTSWNKNNAEIKGP